MGMGEGWGQNLVLEEMDIGNECLQPMRWRFGWQRNEVLNSLEVINLQTRKSEASYKFKIQPTSNLSL